MQNNLRYGILYGLKYNFNIGGGGGDTPVYLDYIYLDGTDTPIDLGFAPTAYMKAVTTIMPTNTGQWVFGSRESGSKNAFNLQVNYSSGAALRACLGDGESILRPATYPEQLNLKWEITEWLFGDAEGYVNFVCENGVTVENSIYFDEEFSSSYNLALFGMNNGGSFEGKYKGYFYSLKIYSGATLIHEYKPCTIGGAYHIKDTISGAQFPLIGASVPKKVSGGTEASSQETVATSDVDSILYGLQENNSGTLSIDI